MRRVRGGIEGRLGGAAARLGRRREAARSRSLGSRLSQSFTRVAVVSTLCVLVALSRFALAVVYLEPQSNLYAAGHGAADDVHTGMLDQEQGLYGYLASQRSSYFDTFVSRGEAEVRDGDRGLETLASGDPSLRSQVDRVLEAQRQWKDGWASQVAQPSQESSTSFSLVTGQSLFSQYLASSNDLLRTIDDRSAALADLSDRSFLAAIGLELALGLLLAAIWTVERRRLRRCIVQPVDGLLSAIEGLRRGEPGPGPAPDAPVEFARIGDELRSTSIALTDSRRELEAQRAAAAESERRTFQLLDGLPTGVLVVNASRVAVYANAVATEMFGEGIATADLADRASVPKPYRPGTDEVMSPAELPTVRALAGEASDVVDIEIRRPDRTLRLAVRGTPIRDALGTVQYGVISFADMSALLEAALERSNRELERFAYFASHDLQEPLRMVVSYVQLLETRYRGRLDRDADDFIGYAVEGAVRMKALLTDLLAFSRIDGENATVGAVDSLACLRTAETRLARLIDESGAHIESGHLPAVLADHGEVCQLFEHLLRNCLTFRGKAPPLIQIGAEAVGDVWQFTVRDNGIGVPPHQRDRVFEVFQRLNTREAYPGTGTGLAMCKKIVEQRGGHIWIEPGEGPGTTVKFTLPTAGGEAESGDRARQVAGSPAAVRGSSPR